MIGRLKSGFAEQNYKRKRVNKTHLRVLPLLIMKSYNIPMLKVGSIR